MRETEKPEQWQWMCPGTGWATDRRGCFKWSPESVLLGKKGDFTIVWHIQGRVSITGAANPSVGKPVPVLRGAHEKIAN